MLLVFHISIATLSLLTTGYAYFNPKKFLINLSILEVVLTIISGTILIVLNHTHILQTCITGLTFIGVVGYGIFAAQQKLTKKL